MGDLMRNPFFAVLGLGLSMLMVRADDAEKLMGLGQMGDFKDGTLGIVAYYDSRIWYNGVRQDPHNDLAITIEMKPGDIVERGDSEGFYRYKFERLTLNRAYFVLWSYSAIHEQIDSDSWRVSQGPLESVERFDVDPTNISWFLDCGPNQVEVNPNQSARTK